MNVSLLRKLERVIFPVFTLALFVALVAPRRTMVETVADWVSWIALGADIIILVLIYKYKPKGEDLYDNGWVPGKVQQIIMPLIVGLVFILPAYNNRADYMLLAIFSMASLLCIGFSVWLFFNREKLDREK